MLRFMRKHASRWVLGIICAVIAVVFVFTFGFKQGGYDKTIAQVGPYKISVAEYYKTRTNMEKVYRNLYGDKFEEAMGGEQRLKEMAVAQLVDKYLYLKKASDMGLKVTNREFADFLASVDAFKRNGAFSQEAYEAILRRNNLEPKTFEDQQRETMLIEKTMRIILDNGSSIDEKAIHDAYLKERGTTKLAAAVFDPAAYRDKVKVDPKELDALYEREKDTQRSENMYHLKYMEIGEKSGVKDDVAYMELLKSKDISAYGAAKGIPVADTGMMKESELVARFARLRPRNGLRAWQREKYPFP